ncbi:hypothetical protein [Yinghuangia sp. YIM S10712]|uniref:hypothetical protein n=1 Tax=Yinghuangia sp. YIM S10712 TaxID=3436930 RepID=UPI003F52F545
MPWLHGASSWTPNRPTPESRALQMCRLRGRTWPGPTCDVRSTRSRHAPAAGPGPNLEVSYLLQRMEEFDGLAVLATNLLHNIDEAFIRRLTYCVRFPFPDAGERRRIWQAVWPAELPRGADLTDDHFSELARIVGDRSVAELARGDADAFTAAAEAAGVATERVQALLERARVVMRLTSS